MGLDPRQQHGGFLVARWKKKLLQAGCKDAQAGPDACYVAVPASQSNESPKPIPGSFLCARLRLRVLQSALQKKTSTPRLKTSSQILGRRRQQQLPWWVRLACVLLLAVFVGSPDPCACRYPSTIIFTTQFFRRSPFP
jgi:hypothetical protein